MLIRLSAPPGPWGNCRCSWHALDAGHRPPWTVWAGEVGWTLVGKTIVSSGPPMAFLPTAVYTPTALEVGPGESLVFYTDGLMDSRGPDEKERLGGDGARAMLKKGFASPQQTVATLAQGEAARRGDAPPQDDLTLLVFGFRA